MEATEENGGSKSIKSSRGGKANRDPQGGSIMDYPWGRKLRGKNSTGMPPF